MGNYWNTPAPEEEEEAPNSKPAKVSTNLLIVAVKTVATKPFDNQKPGTSGLRKKVEVFSQPGYLENFIQSTFNTQPDLKTLVLGGDGRYFSDKAVKTILRIAMANGISEVHLATDFLLGTPAAACEIVSRKCDGGIILTASHNPGGPNGDFGVKFNIATGGPAPSKITNAIFEQTKLITDYKICDVDFSSIDFSKESRHTFGDFTLNIFDGCASYTRLMKQLFDFDALRKFVAREDFTFVVDSLHGVGGVYCRKIFVEELGVSERCLSNCDPKPDFGGGHPDPNLTYAHDLVERMGLGKTKPISIPTFGAAFDGDMDRNMVMGENFFVSPCDSLAVILDYAPRAIPHFVNNKIKGVARSMPTSGAVDVVALKKGLDLYEVPTGWKFFGNLIASGKISLCGEESFGTGSSHVLEKDGPFAVLCWLSILAYANRNKKVGELVSVKDIVWNHWKTYGRNFFTRYDYENVDKAAALKMMDQLIAKFDNPPKFTVGDKEIEVKEANEFEYKDPVDGTIASNQGVRFILADGSRVIFRLSGTGSSGATIRMYIDRYEANPDKVLDASADALKSLIQSAVEIAQIPTLTGRDQPTVIT